MKLAVLFSGGKDSTYAAYLAQQYNHDLSCLISLVSSNKDSFMFHTPSITKTTYQANVMNIPLLVAETSGEKEKELDDLKNALSRAKKEYGIQGVVTGAVESVYQASRVQRICHELHLTCFNPLWQKNQTELLEELLDNKFEIILTAVAAYPLDKTYLGRKIDKTFIQEMKILQQQYALNPAGEGGEFETFVLDCPLFSEPLSISSFTDTGAEHSWRRELEILPLTKKAQQFAVQKHKGQKRKDGSPYVSHPLRVAEIVRQHKQSKHLPELVAAALLHDTLEDTPTTFQELHYEFGELVANLVLQLTSDGGEKERLGKTTYLSQKISSPDMSSWALVIKLADRLDNVSDLITADEPFRSRYKEETLAILKTLEEKRVLSKTHGELITKIKDMLGKI